MPYFFVEREQISDRTIKIYGDDAKHISFSLRMAKGEHITVCDKINREYDCILSDFGDGIVTAEIIEERVSQGEAPIKIRLFQGLPKGDKLETVIQKAVECGVTEIVPFESVYCIAKAKKEAEGRKTERRNRIALEAAKQCGRGTVPSVGETVSFEEAVKEALESDVALICYEDEQETSLKTVLKNSKENGASSISILVGSEGGFSKEEISFAKSHNILPISLGKRILRTETAPVFVLSCISYEFEL